MTVETRAYTDLMRTVKLVSHTNYWKAPCTFVKTPEGFMEA